MEKGRIRRMVCLIALLLSGTAIAGAQVPAQGDMRVSDLTVSRAEGKLFVSMNIDLSELAPTTNREVLLTPTLCGDGDTLRLAQVLVAGRNRYYHHLRNGVAADRTLYRGGDVARVDYRVVVPYEPWMGAAELIVDRETCGCCSEVVAQDGLQLVRLNLDPKVFVPAYVYIRPQAAPKINVVEGTAYIDFPVNRTEIHEHYRRNPDELRKIRATIDAVRDDADTRILALTIKGYASPEGSYANNTRLAKGRTETLKEYVRRLYDFPDTLLSTAYEPEDWDGLERFVAGSALADREGILAIVRSDLEPDAKDRRIRTTYPEQYAYLLREVYPALRHSDYAVTYEVRAYTDVEEIRRLLKSAPQKLSLEEMYLAAQEMEPGSEEYDETFEIAVRMFPDDAVANLNAANTAMRRGDLKAANRYLAKAGDVPEALYARGICAALAGDGAAARMLFEQAAAAGLDMAREAIRQLDELDK